MPPPNTFHKIFDTAQKYFIIYGATLYVLVSDLLSNVFLVQLQTRTEQNAQLDYVWYDSCILPDIGTSRHTAYLL